MRMRLAGVSRLKAPSGGVKYPRQVAPTTGSLILVPPDPMRCSKFFNLNWWKGYCYLLVMVPRVGDGDPSFSVHPTCYVVDFASTGYRCSRYQSLWFWFN